MEEKTLAIISESYLKETNNRQYLGIRAGGAGNPISKIIRYIGNNSMCVVLRQTDNKVEPQIHGINQHCTWCPIRCKESMLYETLEFTKLA